MDKNLILHTKNRFFILVSILLTSILYSQDIDLDKFYYSYDTKNYQKALLELTQIDTLDISNYDKATWFYYHANILSILDKQDIAYKSAKKSESLYESLDKQSDIIDAKFLILDILSHQNSLDIEIKPIIDEIYLYAIKNNDSNILQRTQFRYGHWYSRKYIRDSAFYYYQNAHDIASVSYTHLTLPTKRIV